MIAKDQLTILTASFYSYLK